MIEELLLWMILLDWATILAQVQEVDFHPDFKLWPCRLCLRSRKTVMRFQVCKLGYRPKHMIFLFCRTFTACEHIPSKRQDLCPNGDREHLDSNFLLCLYVVANSDDRKASLHNFQRHCQVSEETALCIAVLQCYWKTFPCHLEGKTLYLRLCLLGCILFKM